MSAARDSTDPIEAALAALPLEIIARHEVGHAVAAWRCGGRVRSIVVGRSDSGDPHGRTRWSIPESPRDYLLVLSAGSLALFAHDCPEGRTFDHYCDWLSTEAGYVKAISGANDWAQILARTGQTEGYGIEDFLERAVQPYFADTFRILDSSRALLDGLTTLLLACPSGLGRRSLQRFFNGRPYSSWAERLDRPGMMLAGRFESW